MSHQQSATKVAAAKAISSDVETIAGRDAKTIVDRQDLTSEIVDLARELISIPSITNCADERLTEVHRCCRFISDLLDSSGLDVRVFDGGPYSSLVAGFPDTIAAPVTLVGHFDVVKPEPDDSQFEPRIVGDYLWGRGAADMKTVVASMITWMRHRVRCGAPYPPINLLLVGNEENGEGELFGTPHILDILGHDWGWSPELMLVGERTGEVGDELFGKICLESRGIIRMQVVATGKRGHTGVATVPRDMADVLTDAKEAVTAAMHRHFTLSSDDNWQTSVRFPFMNLGEVGVYNITADQGILGVEVRPIPSDDTAAFIAEVEGYCQEHGLRSIVESDEGGVACPPDNPHLSHLLAAVEEVSGEPAVIGKKMPGSSARFAPGGNAVIWGQSGVGPHSVEERHFIPSIAPYMEVLDNLADRLLAAGK